jgi:hypothetical protein
LRFLDRLRAGLLGQVVAFILASRTVAVIRTIADAAPDKRTIAAIADTERTVAVIATDERTSAVIEAIGRSVAVVRTTAERNVAFIGTPKKRTLAVLRCSVADPGYLSRIRMFSIPDPNFFHPGSASNNLSKF